MDTHATDRDESMAETIKVRSQPILLLPKTIDAMGFPALPIYWSVVCTSIQTGVVDGNKSNVIFWDNECFRDQLDCFV